MTKKEREYLEKICRDNIKRAQEVVDGEFFETVFKTPEERMIFAQGMRYANECFEMYFNIDKSLRDAR
jgi:hypothetical protein